jgi:hypothetical protein
MTTSYSASIVTDGLIACLDASNIKSYPGNGSTWYDLSGRQAHGTVNGTVSFVSAGRASYFNFATAADTNYISSTASQPYMDMTIVFQPDFSLVGGSSIVGLVSDSTAATSLDDSLRFTGANGTGPWTLVGRNPGDTNDWAYPSATNYYVNSTLSTTLVSGWNIFGGYRTNVTGIPLSFSYFLGSGGYTGRGFQGKIAACYFYNRELSAADQLRNFNALRGRFGL